MVERSGTAREFLRISLENLEISNFQDRKKLRGIYVGKLQRVVFKWISGQKQPLLARMFPRFLAGKAFDSPVFPENSEKNLI